MHRGATVAGTVDRRTWITSPLRPASCCHEGRRCLRRRAGGLGAVRPVVDDRVAGNAAAVRRAAQPKSTLLSFDQVEAVWLDELTTRPSGRPRVDDVRSATAALPVLPARSRAQDVDVVAAVCRCCQRRRGAGGVRPTADRRRRGALQRDEVAATPERLAGRPRPPSSLRSSCSSAAGRRRGCSNATGARLDGDCVSTWNGPASIGGAQLPAAVAGHQVEEVRRHASASVAAACVVAPPQRRRRSFPDRSPKRVEEHRVPLMPEPPVGASARPSPGHNQAVAVRPHAGWTIRRRAGFDGVVVSIWKLARSRRRPDRRHPRPAVSRRDPTIAPLPQRRGGRYLTKTRTVDESVRRVREAVVAHTVECEGDVRGSTPIWQETVWKPSPPRLDEPVVSGFVTSVGVVSPIGS